MRFVSDVLVLRAAVVVRFGSNRYIGFLFLHF